MKSIFYQLTHGTVAKLMSTWMHFCIRMSWNSKELLTLLRKIEITWLITVTYKNLKQKIHKIISLLLAILFYCIIHVSSKLKSLWQLVRLSAQVAAWYWHCSQLSSCSQTYTIYIYKKKKSINNSRCSFDYHTNAVLPCFSWLETCPKS